MYVLSYAGGANLLRHAEGATWLAIVTVSELFDTHALGIFLVQLDMQIKSNAQHLQNRCIHEYTLIVCRKIKTIKQTAKQNDDKSYQEQVRAQSQNEHIFEARNINASENVVTGLSFTYGGLRRCT